MHTNDLEMKLIHEMNREQNLFTQLTFFVASDASTLHYIVQRLTDRRYTSDQRGISVSGRDPTLNMQHLTDRRYAIMCDA